jgi:hypothetical protein
MQEIIKDFFGKRFRVAWENLRWLILF